MKENDSSQKCQLGKHGYQVGEHDGEVKQVELERQITKNMFGIVVMGNNSDMFFRKIT